MPRSHHRKVKITKEMGPLLCRCVMGSVDPKSSLSLFHCGLIAKQKAQSDRVMERKKRERMRVEGDLATSQWEERESERGRAKRRGDRVKS